VYRALAQECECATDRLGDGELRRLELHLARLDLGEIQDLVYEIEQMPPRARDVADVLHLPLVEFAEESLVKDVGEADDGVERSA